VNGQLFTN